MLILNRIAEEILVPPEETGNIQENTLKRIYKKYLMKASPFGLCVAISNLSYKGNIILRQSSDVLVEVNMDILCIQFKEGEYFTGTVIDMNEKGIKINFMGILEGTIRPGNMHLNTHYDQENKRWLFIQGNNSAYPWNLSMRVFFKIHRADWHLCKHETSISDVISLYANEMGLGPEQWWI